MKTSKNLKFQIPELDDQANITVIGSALEALDDAAGDALAMNGDASSAQVTFTRADSRSNIESGSTFATIFAKISRYFADLKDAAFQSVANNLTTTSSGYVLDARQGKALNDSISKGSTQLGGLYFGQDSAGKWGYKTSANGTVNPFRNPTGTATAGDVLVGKTFANSSSDEVAGTMPNRGSLTMGFVPGGLETETKTLEAGYYTGGTITVDGSAAYNNGYDAGQNYSDDTIHYCTYTFLSDTENGGLSQGVTIIPIPAGYTTLKKESGSTAYYNVSNELSALVNINYKSTFSGSVNIAGYKYLKVQVSQQVGSGDHEASVRWCLTK